MVNYIIGSLLILHGLVHLLYFGHSARYYELKPGLNWPDGSWIFTKFIEDEDVRSLAKILCILAALGFIAGGLGYFTWETWSDMVIGGSALFSSLIFIMFWNGKFHQLDAQGGIGVLINLVILSLLLLY